jgi:ATP-binding cassette, subfamily B, bacterial MsbA
MSRLTLSWTEMVAQRRPKLVPLFRAYARYLPGERARLGVVVALGLACAAVELAALALLVPLYDVIAGRQQSASFVGTPLAAFGDRLNALSSNDRVLWIVFLLFVLAVARESMSYLNMRTCARVQLDLMRLFRGAVLRRLFSMPLERYNRTASMNHYYVLMTFAQMGSDFAFAAVRAIVPAILLFLYLGVLVYLSPAMTLVATSVGCAMLLAARLVLARQQAWSAKAAAVGSVLNHQSLQILSAMRTVRLMNRQRDFVDRHDRALHDWIEATFGATRLQALVSPINQVSASFALLAIVFLGATLSPHEGVDWLQFVVLFMIVMMRIAGPIGTLNALRSEIAGRSAGADFLMDFLTTNRDEPIMPSPAPRGLPGDIELSGVRFAYDGGQEVVRGIDLRIARGSTVALVGRSGAGKSTILDLICKLSAPTQGRILCAGKDIAEIPDAEWRAEIAVVSQAPFLLDDTLRENIRVARPTASDAEVEAAARLANVEEFAKDLPGGYDSWIGERGALLSGGQGQRVAIARALLANPSLLILDEATSAQDSESEAEIRTAIERLARDRTVIIVAHRLATVMQADAIHVIEDGKIVESGTHAELAARGGRYARFVELQSLDAPGDAEAKPEAAGMPFVERQG